MQIDWFTFGAQIVNFAILVLLLKHFLYDRIVGAMDAREKRITEHLDEAQAKERDAEQRQAEFRRKKEEIEQEREAILRSARKKAEEQHEDEKRRLRREIEEQRHRWTQGLEREREDFLKALRRETARQVCAVSRQALREFADENLNARISATLVAKLDSLDDEYAETLGGEARANGGTLQVRSSHALPDDDRRKLKEAARRRLGEKIDIEMTRDEDLICGIELSAGGQRLAWNLERHLDRLEHSLAERLDQAATRSRKESNGERDDRSH